MNQKRLFLIGIPEHHIKKAIERAKTVGFYVIIGDTEDSLNTHQHLLNNADEQVAVDFTNYNQLYNLCNDLYQKKHIDSIFTFKENALYNVSKIQQQFKMKGNSPNVVSTCLDKYKTRQLLKDAHFDSPSFKLCKNIQEVRDFWDNSKHPIILKPRSLQGSIGVIKVNSKEEIEDAFNQCATFNERHDSILIEEFIDGKEISIEGVVHKGEVQIFGITEKFLFPGTFIESGHLSPYDCDNMLFYKKIIQKVIKVLGIQLGPFHIEAYCKEDKLIIGEVHTRYGGDNIVTITELAIGCDMHTPIFSELAQSKHKIQLHSPDKICGVFFLNPNPGVVQSIDINQHLHSLVNLVDYHIDCKVGDTIKTMTNSYDRVGWLILKGKNRMELKKAFKQATKTIKIITS